MINYRFFYLFALCTTLGHASLEISKENALSMSKKIWDNECKGSIKGLTSWNDGEDFASMGIGHFIWYPEGRQPAFEETFPALLAFLEKRGFALPPIVKEKRTCPWYTKEAFDAEFHELPMRQLRDFLYETRAEQALFMAQRLENTLPKILARAQTEKAKIETLFNLLAKDAKGLFILLDYVNFKGDGTNPSERYQGQGWGLLQVLQAMPPHTTKPHEDFVASAVKLLTLRVKNAPAIRDEERWLKGWTRRVNRYLETE